MRGAIALWLVSLLASGGVLTAQAAGTAAQMISPAQGSMFDSASVTFTWDAGSGVNFYALWIGNAPRTFDLSVWAEPARSRTVKLPADGRRIYVTLWSWLDGKWQGNDYDYVAFTAPPPVKAQLLSPADGSTFTNATVTFTWDAGTGVNYYALWVGSKADTFDLYARLETGLSRTLTLPVDGRAIYVTLWSWINGKWEKNSYTFTAYTGPPPVAAQMVNPTDGSTFTNRTVTFTWDGGIGVSYIGLWIGSTAKSFDLYAGFERGLSRTVRLPVDGRPIYVTLWSWINGKWESHAYTYTAYTQPGLVKAKITSPTNGSNLTSTSLELIWDAGEGVTRYALWVGSRPMGFDLYARVETGLTRTVTVPADGRTIYVTLWSFLDGIWQPNFYTYTAPQPVKAQMTNPIGGQILPGGTVTFNWDAGTGVSKYALWVGSTPSSYDLFAGYNTTRSATLTLPKDGRALYVTLWSLVNGKWESNSYLYKAYTNAINLFGTDIRDWFFDGIRLLFLPSWLNGGSSTFNLGGGTLSLTANRTLALGNTATITNFTGTLLLNTNSVAGGTFLLNTNTLVGALATLSNNASVRIGNGTLCLAPNTVATGSATYDLGVVLATNGTLRIGGTNTFNLVAPTNIFSGGSTLLLGATNIVNGGGIITLTNAARLVLASNVTISAGGILFTNGSPGILQINTNTLSGGTLIINTGGSLNLSNTGGGVITLGTGTTLQIIGTNGGGSVLILNR